MKVSFKSVVVDESDHLLGSARVVVYDDVAPEEEQEPELVIIKKRKQQQSMMLLLLATTLLLVLGVVLVTFGSSSQNENELRLGSAQQRLHKPIRGSRGGGIDAKTTTPDGWPLPLTKAVMATQSVIPLNNSGQNNNKALRLKKYPKIAHPLQEPLAPNEMRLICLGSGNPNIRRGQAAAGWLVQLGNGDNFVFDIGSGTVGNLWSLGFPPAIFDKLFLTHLHLDHVGDILALYDAMIWGRNRPLHVYGSSGSQPKYGLAAFVESIKSAASWHVHAKSAASESDGMIMQEHEFDYSKFNPDTAPNQLVYDENGVKIYAFPVVHEIVGAVGYRLEWNGRTMTYHGDGTPNTFEAHQAAGVDVFIHESFLDAKSMAEIYSLPLAVANEITSCHTTADRLGRLFDIAQPKLGVAYHYYQDDFTIDPFFRGVTSTYDDHPVMLAQDFSVINVTPDQIVCRQAETDLLVQTPPNPDGTKGQHAPVEVEDTPPQWLQDTIIP